VKRPQLGIVGLGIIGRQELQLWSKSTYDLIAYDTNQSVLERLAEDGKHERANPIIFTADLADLQSCLAIVLCLPTGTSDGAPTLDAFEKFSEAYERVKWREDLLIIIASTIPIGFTRRMSTRWRHAIVAHAPERFDPGRPMGLDQIPRVVAGLTERARKTASELYGSVGVRTTAASSVEVAEASKLLENAFRLVNIAFANEFAFLCEAMGISAAETIEVASTKPFGFMAHYPGAGAGGMCIPVVPRFLVEAAHERGRQLPILETSLQANDEHPRAIAETLRHALLGAKGRPRVLVVGATYKPNYPDTRGSAALRLIRDLRTDYRVEVLDPHVTQNEMPEGVKLHVALPDDSFDAVVIAVRHSTIPIEGMRRLAPVFIDLTRGELTTPDMGVSQGQPPLSARSGQARA
jgi:UDP-N-acetyl-D-glucosamine dehydrogenase